MALKLLCRANAYGYNFDDRYLIDEKGNIFFNKVSKFHSKKISRFDNVKSFINKYGYVEYNLRNANKKYQHIQAHRAVACVFIDNPYKKAHVNHIDGNKRNNHVLNLEWTTPSENEQHSYNTLNKTAWNKGKKLPSGKNYRGTIRPVIQYDIYGNIIKEWFNPKEAESEGFSLKQISAVCNGAQKTHKKYIWKYKNEN